MTWLPTICRWDHVISKTYETWRPEVGNVEQTVPFPNEMLAFSGLLTCPYPLPSGKLTFNYINYGKSPCSMGKFTISMVHVQYQTVDITRGFQSPMMIHRYPWYIHRRSCGCCTAPLVTGTFALPRPSIVAHGAGTAERTVHETAIPRRQKKM